ncbi:hypothetical protein [Thomasclavelia sp.]
MENKKNKLLILMIVLCIMVPIGGAIAYFHADTSSNNKLSSGNVGIEIKDATTNEDGQINHDGITFNFGYPGAIKDKQTFVENISNNDLYTRITVTKYWEDEDGNKIIDANPKLIEIITNAQDNWIIQDNDVNSEVVHFYYKKILKPGETTDLFVNQIKLSGMIDDSEMMIYSGLNAHLAFEAEAVQKVGAKSAIMSEWGLNVNIDDHGVIQYVEE